MKTRTDKEGSTPPQTGHPGWIEIFVEIHPVAQDAVSDFLFELGSKGLVFDEEENKSLKAYLPFTDEFEEIRSRVELFLQRVKEFFPEAQQSSLRFSTLRDEDWSLTWRRHFRIEHPTRRLTVVPVWESLPEAAAGTVIRMDPGPAFGTGSHPTTRMCLEAIEQHCIAGASSVFDVGTGSGILAIYAAKLGARRVLAIDTDPEAIRWARRNIALNRCSTLIELSSESVAEVNDVFSVVVANLTRDTLLELLADCRRCLEKNGILILAGLLQEQVQEVEKPLRHLGFEDVQVITQAEWASITARRKE